MAPRKQARAARSFKKVDPTEIRTNLRKSRVADAELLAYLAAQDLTQLEILSKNPDYVRPEGFEDALEQRKKAAKDQQTKLQKIKGSLSPAQKKEVAETWATQLQELKTSRLGQLEGELASHMELLEHIDLYDHTRCCGQTDLAEATKAHERAIDEIEAALTAAEGS